LKYARTVKKIGSVSLWAINWHHLRSGVGIWIIPKYWERGLGSKTINLIKLVAFNHLNLNRIEAYIATQNKRSIKMFKKCSFVEEGVLKKYLKIDGKFEDALIVACLRN
jgi:ribosomal-protein-alanine N-acetyltransferase